MGANLGSSLKEKNTCVLLKPGALVIRVHDDLHTNVGYKDSDRVVFLCGTNDLSTRSLRKAILDYDDMLDTALSLNINADIFFTGLQRRWNDSKLNQHITSFNHYLEFKAEKKPRLIYVKNDSYLQDKHYKKGLHLYDMRTSQLACNMRSQCKWY